MGDEDAASRRVGYRRWLARRRLARTLGHSVASMTLGNPRRTINKLPLVKTFILPPQYSGCGERQQERLQVGGGEAAKSRPPPTTSLPFCSHHLCFMFFPVTR